MNVKRLLRLFEVSDKIKNICIKKNYKVQLVYAHTKTQLIIETKLMFEISTVKALRKHNIISEIIILFQKTTQNLWQQSFKASIEINVIILKRKIANYK